MIIKKTQQILLYLSLVVFTLPVVAVDVIKSQAVDFKLETVAKGFGIPWGLVFLNPDQLLITERDGGIKLLDVNTGRSVRISGAPDVYARGQGGLLDVAIAKNYAQTGWIYFTYVKEQFGEGVTVLSRAKLRNTKLHDWQDLLITDSATDSTRHFGSRIAFDKDGYVYFTVGDRGDRPNGQDLSNHAGTVMRLHPDGKVPDDNPFNNRNDARNEIWSYGHRNPQGISYDPLHERLWLIEHGPRGGDEINLVVRGKNYGWPVISYGKEYWGPLAVGEGTHREGMEQPVKQYTPSIAPGSLLLYSGNAFKPWKGNLFSGALKLTHLNRVVLSDDGKAIDEERLLGDLNERIRALAEDSQGWIYFSTDSGKIYRMAP